MRELNILCNTAGYEKIRNKLDDVVTSVEDTGIQIIINSCKNDITHIKLINFDRDYSDYVLENVGIYDDEDDSIQKLILKCEKIINDDDSDIALYVAYIGEDLIDLEESCTSLALNIINAKIKRSLEFKED